MAKMTKQTKALLLVLGGVILLAGGLYVGRNFLADARTEKVAQDESIAGVIDKMMLDLNGQMVGSGEFVDADAFHTASGMAEVYSTDNGPVLLLDEEFDVRSGPDLVVYLSKNRTASGDDLGDFVSLGDLHAQAGAQAYSLPEDYQEFGSVVIWCRAFGVGFGYADLSY
ncbi:MAG: DM13 domain-containing protein [Patescibacteria group bacterium]